MRLEHRGHRQFVIGLIGSIKHPEAFAWLEHRPAHQIHQTLSTRAMDPASDHELVQLAGIAGDDDDEEWWERLIGPKRDPRIYTCLNPDVSSRGLANTTNAAAAASAVDLLADALPSTATRYSGTKFHNRRSRASGVDWQSKASLQNMLAQHWHIEVGLKWCPRIHTALARTWLSGDDRDLTDAALNGLADSLADRVRALVDLEPPFGPIVFKVGLTRDPSWRFLQAPYAYSSQYGAESWMEILLVSCVSVIRWCEAAVIARVSNIAGCQNVAPGGESPPPDSEACYLYVVGVPVGMLVASRLQAARAAQSRHMPYAGADAGGSRDGCRVAGRVDVPC